MSITNRRPVVGYLVAVAGVVLAGLSPVWLTPLTGDTPPMRLLLVLVVGLAAWVGDIGPGLLATAPGALAIVIANDAPGDWSVLSNRLIRFGSLALVISILFAPCMRPGGGSRSRTKNIAGPRGDIIVSWRPRGRASG